MDFVGNQQWLQFGTNVSTRSIVGPIEARDTSTGTYPVGSMWRRNPIPACQGPGGSTNGRGGGNQTFYPNAGGAVSCSPESYAGGTWQDPFYPKGPQFPPPGGYPGIAEKIPGLYTYGFGNNFDQPGANAGGGFLFSIVDKLQVPQDLPEGEYVLSFRYVAAPPP